MQKYTNVNPPKNLFNRLAGSLAQIWRNYSTLILQIRKSNFWPEETQENTTSSFGSQTNQPSDCDQLY